MLCPVSVAQHSRHSGSTLVKVPLLPADMTSDFKVTLNPKETIDILLIHVVMSPGLTVSRIRLASTQRSRASPGHQKRSRGCRLCLPVTTAG